MLLRPRWTFFLLGAVLLTLGAVAFQNFKVEAQQMTQVPKVQFQQWQHPGSGEKVNVNFDGVKTTVERDGKVSEFQTPPFDEAAALAEAREGLRFQFRWTVWNVESWRERLIMMEPSVAAAKKKFQELGFPIKLWDDIDVYLKHTGKPVPKDGPPEMMAAYSSSVVIVAEGKEAPPEREGQVIIRPSDPAFKDNLLFHPADEIKATFAQMYLHERIGVSGPPADTTLHEQTRQIEQEGFMRVTARRPDGTLWLTPALEPHRAALQASEKPVVRLSADPKRTPNLWESKVGGVPYRVKGAAWPMSTEKTPRPLVFLAQVNFAEISADGKALPDYPSTGLLQFFILNGEFMGAEAMYNAEGALADLNAPQDNYRVIYLPEVVQDETKLEATAVKPEYDPATVARLKKEGHDSLISDTYQIWDNLPFAGVQSFPPPAVALNAMPDREPVSGADNAKMKLLGLPKNDWDDEQLGNAVSDLYNISPGKHKVGGYPDFTQADRRPEDTTTMLLFQLDSDPALNLMWGDVGTANFFIRPEDLKKRDFSKVAYHWDCG